MQPLRKLMGPGILAVHAVALDDALSVLTRTLKDVITCDGLYQIGNDFIHDQPKKANNGRHNDP